MKNIWKLLGIIAISAVLAFSMTACGGDDDPGTQTGGGGDATFTLSADGDALTKTSAVTITFSKNVTNLLISEIAVGAGNGAAEKGATVLQTPGNAKEWKLTSINVTKSGTITVTINHSGVASAAQSVKVYDGETSGDSGDPVYGVAHQLWPSDIVEWKADNSSAVGVDSDTFDEPVFYFGYDDALCKVNTSGTWELRFGLDPNKDISGYDFLIFDLTADDGKTLDSLAGIYTRFYGDGDFTVENNPLLRSLVSDHAGETTIPEWIEVKIPISEKAKWNPQGSVPNRDTILGSLSMFGPSFARRSNDMGPNVPAADAKFYMKNFRLGIDNSVPDPEWDSSLNVPSTIPVDYFSLEGSKPVGGKAGKRLIREAPAYAVENALVLFNIYDDDPVWVTQTLEVGFANESQNLSTAEYFSFEFTTDNFATLDAIDGFEPRLRSKAGNGPNSWTYAQFDATDIFMEAKAGITEANFTGAWLTIRFPITEGEWDLMTVLDGAGLLENGCRVDTPSIAKILANLTQFRPRFLASSLIGAGEEDENLQLPGRIYFRNFAPYTPPDEGDDDDDDEEEDT